MEESNIRTGLGVLLRVYRRRSQNAQGRNSCPEKPLFKSMAVGKQDLTKAASVLGSWKSKKL